LPASSTAAVLAGDGAGLLIDDEDRDRDVDQHAGQRVVCPAGHPVVLLGDRGTGTRDDGRGIEWDGHRPPPVSLWPHAINLASRGRATPEG
jgi:hypothetical protein